MAIFTEDQLAEIVCRTLSMHDIDPTDEYIAAAGRDYGLVQAYRMSNGRFAIAFGDNGETCFDIADDADNLAYWLEYDGLYGFDRALQTANVRGIDALPEIDSSAETFRVLCTRHFFGPSSVSSWETDKNENELEFGNLADAEAYVRNRGGHGRA